MTNPDKNNVRQKKVSHLFYCGLYEGGELILYGLLWIITYGEVFTEGETECRYQSGCRVQLLSVSSSPPLLSFFAEDGNKRYIVVQMRDIIV